MTLSESWQPLDIDTPDAAPLPRPGSEVHVVALVATAAARRDGWGARAALEIARGWGAEGARVVLCDLDLEAPALHSAAGLDNLEGISDALLFGTSFQRMAQPLSDGLYIATAGTAVPNGEALRTHPRWRAFAEGFTEAEAVMALYLPEEAPGTDALLELCHAVVLLGAKDEVGAVSLPGRMPLLAVAGPEGLAATRGAVPLGAAEVAAEAPGEPAVDPAEADPFWAMDVDLDAPPEEGESRLLEAEAGSTPEIPLAASLDSLELMDAEEPLAEPPGPDAWDTHQPPELAGAEDPPSPPAPPTLEEILDERAAEPRPMGRLETPPSAPPRARRFEEKKEGRSGSGSLILLILLLGVLAVLVAGWLGLVEIPGISRSTSAGVEEAGAAVPALGGTGEGAAEAAPDSPSEATSAGAVSGVESPAAAYVLALGSYSSHDSARARARVLADAIPDVPFLVAPVEVQGTAFYRLLAGSAPDTAAIRAVQAELSGAAPGARDWIMRRAGLGFLLGAPATLALAERQVDALGALGIPAHILRYDDGAGVTEYRVYAGAYADPGEARYMARILAENDIQNATLTERKGVRPR